MKANYDLISQQWAEIRKELPTPDKVLFNEFIHCLPLNARLLDLGCGTGVPIDQLMLKHGYQVLGVDCSEKLLEVARDLLPEAHFVQAELETYDIESSYQGIIMWDCLFHIPREHHEPILSKVYRALEMGGVAIISSGGSEQNIPAFTGTMFDVEFYYDAYPVDDLVNLCKKIGFSILKQKLVNKPDGIRDKGRLGLLLIKE
ncbi:class I SAM-dependent methyltransferase [Vibrio genomosp. F6]|nr:class I SAM-dependent methyltransferase [Vibrio genomosp. F6]